jgi:hypothetical protein
MENDEGRDPYSESTSGPIIKPQWPYIFDLIDDPNEEWDLIEKSLQGAWLWDQSPSPGGTAAEHGPLPEHRAGAEVHGIRLSA